MGGRGLQAEQIVQQSRLGRLDRRSFRIGNQCLGPRSDLLRRTQSDEGACLLDQLRRTARLQPLQQPDPTRRNRSPSGKPVQQRPEPHRPPDMPKQGSLAPFGRLQPSDGGHQDADIPGHGPQVQARQQVAEQREHLGIRRLRRGAVEDLIPHLQVFAGATRTAHLLAKHLAHIGIAGRLRSMRHVRLNDGHREVRPQHHLAANLIVGHIGPRPDVLAVKVQQRPRWLQDIRFDGHCTRGDERREQPLAFCADCRLLGHWPSIFRTAATNSVRGTST